MASQGEAEKKRWHGRHPEVVWFRMLIGHAQIIGSIIIAMIRH